MDGDEIKAAFGINIRNLRLYRRFTQAELAEKADISIIYLSNIERGVKFPKPAILGQIAEGLNVDIYELFKMEHTPNIRVKDNTKLINRISKDMLKKVVKTMEGVFNSYIK